MEKAYKFDFVSLVLNCNHTVVLKKIRNWIPMEKKTFDGVINFCSFSPTLSVLSITTTLLLFASSKMC